MTKTRFIAIVAATTIAATSVFACSNDTEPPLIFAAASLIDVLEEVAEHYESETGEKVRFSFGGSNLLANQIIAGANADAVIVAGKTPIHNLIEDGKANQGDETKIISNNLVAVRSKNSTSTHSTPDQLINAGKIAMPDPATAPAGEYFEAALTELNLWNQLQDQIIPTLDVRAALAAATSGNVAYAFVYETDAISTDDVEIAFTIETTSEASKPRYYAMPLTDDDETNRFIDYLTSPQATAIFEDHGFIR